MKEFLLLIRTEGDHLQKLSGIKVMSSNFETDFFQAKLSKYLTGKGIESGQYA
jgi:hypothetical protein